MKVRDYVSIIKGDVSINITYADRKITEFKAPYWDTIEKDILDLEIKSVAFPGKSVIIETKTGRPTIVSTPAELEAAINDEGIKFIKLGADITDSLNFASGQKILDLAGHELIAPDEYSAVIFVAGDAVLDVFDSEGGGLVNGDGCAETVSADEKAHIYLHSGDYVGGKDDEYGSATVIAGGEALVGIYGGYYVNLYNETDMELNKVLAVNGSGVIRCFGGKYKDESPAEYVADGFQAVEIPDTDPVVYEVKSIL